MEKLPAFIERINLWAAEHYPEMPQQTINIDCALSPRQLNVHSIQPLALLEPFGSGNELPVFQIPGCTLQGVYPIGEGKHLRLRFAGEDTVFYAVYFGMSQENFPYAVGEVVDLAVTVDVGEWNGELRVSVKVKDIHLTGIDYDKIHHSEQVYQRLRRSEPGGGAGEGAGGAQPGRHRGGLPLPALKRQPFGARRGDLREAAGEHLLPVQAEARDRRARRDAPRYPRPGRQACGGGAQSAEGGYLPVENFAGAAIPKPAGRRMNRQPGCGQSPVMEEANEILCN